MQVHPKIAEVARDAEWLAHRYDPDFDAFHFARVGREDHRASTFLIDEQLPPEKEVVPVFRPDALAAAIAAAPVHFLFHSAFCCSTLIARALDVEGVSMALKEPVVLNDLMGWKQRGGDRRRIAEALDHALRLLARPFGPGEAVVIKPSNVVNVLAPAMLAMRPAARAVLLHAPLPVFLASIAKKGMWGRVWVRDLLVKLRTDSLVDLGFTEQDYLRHTDLQAAAVGWLAQQALFHRMVAQFGEDRVRTIDSETLVARPSDAMKSVVNLFELPMSADAAGALGTGAAFTRHSKLGGAFGKAERAAEQDEAERAHSEEINMVAAWAEAVAAQANLPLKLGAPLLD